MVITGGPPTYTSQEPLTSSDEAGLKTGMSQLLKSEHKLVADSINF